MAAGDAEIRAFEATPLPGPRLVGELDGAGPPLVLLHGLTATRRYVLQGSRWLARRGGRQLVSYDARGHGRSAPAPDPAAYGYPDLVGDLEAVLDERGLERVALAGSSMGAATAMAFALAHPGRVEAMVQITPAYAGAPEADPAGWDALAAALERGDLDAFVRLSGADRVPEPFREPAVLATRQRLERHDRPEAVADALRAVPRSAAFDGLERLAEVDVPVLVVGSRDETDPGHPLAVAREYERRLPRGSLLVEDEGDSPLAWRGAALSRAIAGFLDQL